MRKFLNQLINFVVELKSGHHLGLHLTLGQLKAQYRSAALGLFWLILLPVLNTIVWVTMTNSGIIFQVEDQKSNFIYIFLGSVLWSIFSEAVGAPLNTINNYKSILTKVFFVREGILISIYYTLLINSIIKLIIAIFVLALISNFYIMMPVLGAFSVLSIIIVGVAIGFFIAPIGMLYSDIERVLPVVLQAAMFLTPVVFIAPEGSFMQEIFFYNPISYIIEDSRSSIIFGDIFYSDKFKIILVLSGVTTIISWLCFKVMLPILIERLGG